MIDYDGYTDYRNYTKDRVQPYSDSELKALWLGFAGDPDEAEKLADFAQCSREEATEMIADYRTTAAAKRAAQAEEKRRKDKDTSKRKKPVKNRKTAIQEYVDLSDDDVSGDAFPVDAIIAGAINERHGISTILAEGRRYKNRTIVMVERIRDETGMPTFRTKTVVYSYHKSLENAIQAAKKPGVSLKMYGGNGHRE